MICAFGIAVILCVCLIAKKKRAVSACYADCGVGPLLLLWELVEDHKHVLQQPNAGAARGSTAQHSTAHSSPLQPINMSHKG